MDISLMDDDLPGVRPPILLAPAGDWDCVKAAVENGADAVYFGLNRFNARMRARNFTDDDLPDVMRYLHQRGVRGYVTLNTLVFTRELAAAQRYIQHIIDSGADAVIVQDVGICRLIRHLSPDFPIHASTQMTVTSAQGVAFAQQLGCEVVVLARECSIQHMDKIQRQLTEQSIQMPLEVFVHGALCVAYSGQCLTSEALGGRSANRGECAQACRMTYDLVVDGRVKEMGDRHYLLSPQDLAGLDALPDLIRTGISCLKIEGRLKQPEYVASVTQIYRQAIDRVVNQRLEDVLDRDRDRYQLEMAFSRGLYSGWLHGINNQELVHARFGKKRGVYLGEVVRVDTSHTSKGTSKGTRKNRRKELSRRSGRPHRHKLFQPRSQNSRSHQLSEKSSQGSIPRITVQLQGPLKAGDGVMFDGGHPNGKEEGGRVYTIDWQGDQQGNWQGDQQGNRAVLTFGRDGIDPHRIRPGDGLWKTSDPALDKAVRQSFTTEEPHFQRPIQITVQGQAGEFLVAIAQDEQGHTVQLTSTMPLVTAHSHPLSGDRLEQQFSRLGHTPFMLASLNNEIEGAVMLPVRELNRLRRGLVEQLLEVRSRPKTWTLHSTHTVTDLLPQIQPSTSVPSTQPIVIPLVRTLEQLNAVLTTDLATIYCELDDLRRYRDAVQLVRSDQEQTNLKREIWVTPPRITKPAEQYLLNQVRRCDADGYLIRNFDQLAYFADRRCVGDFSLNVANPLTAAYFLDHFKLERLTASYDLNIQQLDDLLTTCPPHWFEVTLHQHMPMFHMEHCVFCSFLSDGTDASNCGRPCDRHEVKLRDRTGAEHLLRADAGCRNTVYNSRAQTGAESVHRLIKSGLRHIRIEFLQESAAQVIDAIDLYQSVVDGTMTGTELWQRLKLQNQLGVTRGQLDA